jgi:hypothetical protein
MTNKNLLWFVAMGVAGCLWLRPILAQENTAAKTSAEEQKVYSAFRIDFTLDESENGKAVNTRHYSMNVVPGFANSNEIKIGSRVPVEGKEGAVQYIDVGTNIWLRLAERGDSYPLEVRAELSNFANPEQENKTVMPLLRQLHINASTVAAMGKPTVLGVVDDPNSKRQFILTATVTRQK